MTEGLFLKNRAIHILTGLLLVVVALAAAGCGAGGSGQKPAAGAGGQKTPDGRYVRVATAADNIPFEFKSGGKYTGFDIDLINAVAAVNHWRIEFNDVNYDQIAPALQRKEDDLAVSAIPLGGTGGKIDFSLPYFRSALSIVVPAKNKTIRGWADLKNQKIGVQLATAAADRVCTVPGATVSTYNDAGEALQALRRGDVAAVVDDYPVLAYVLRQGDDGLKLIDVPDTGRFYGIAVAAGRPGMLAAVNGALRELKKDGRYAAIYKKWFGCTPPAYLPGYPAAGRRTA